MSHRSSPALVLLGALALLALPPRADAQRRPNARVEAPAAAGRAPGGGERRIVCRGAAIPAGYILVDDLRDRSSCGGENPAALNAYNIWAIEKTDGRPAGTVIEACAAAPTPPGWTVVDIYRSHERCGHPDGLFVANVKRIRKN